MSDQEAFARIGNLIDYGADASYEGATKRGLYLLDDLSKRDLVVADGALVEYFRANAWAAMSQISNASARGLFPHFKLDFDPYKREPLSKFLCRANIRSCWHMDIVALPFPYMTRRETGGLPLSLRQLSPPPDEFGGVKGIFLLLW